MLRIASERTGYPADLLHLDAGIEADLGIDSIKRVEILTALKRVMPVAAPMEQLTRARTFADLLALLDAAPAVTAPTAAVSVKAELLRIASERTGYPADLLHLDAGIEADLGIDSIKRVEILTALKRVMPVAAPMEQLTRARTFADLLALLDTAPASSTPPAAIAPAATVSVKAELLRIASERTGYPADLLHLDAGIEADLGIDSIKRVEILTALKRVVPVAAPMEQLTRARTFADLLALLQPSVSVPPPAAAVPRYRLTLQELENPRTSPRFHPGRVVVITDDESGLASGLAAAFERAGERVVLLRHRAENGSATESCIEADLSGETGVASALNAVRHLRGRIGALIHLLPLRPDLAKLDLAQSLETWRGQVRVAIRSLYLLIRAAQSDLEAAGLERGALIATATARGGSFGIDAASDMSPLQQMAADYLKTAAQELTGVACRVVDLDPADSPTVRQEILLSEIAAAADAPVQVGRRGGRRVTPVPQLAPVVRTEPVIEAGSVIVLTGGARGITARVARALAPRRATLILAGSSMLPAEAEPAETAELTDPAALKGALLIRLRATQGNVRAVDVEAALRRLLRDREIRRTMEDLRSAGATVEYHGLDVRDEAAMSAFIEGVHQRHGRLDVFIHGAGIIEDKLIRDKTPESFDRVVHTKADSVFLLARLLHAGPLRAFLLMSSITAVFGNRGQADYAAANGALNGLAVALNSRWPGRVSALCWGPWDQGGMVSDEVRRQFLERGVQLIPPVEGAQAVIDEIENTGPPEAIVVFGGGPWSRDALPEPAAPQAGEEYAMVAL